MLRALLVACVAISSLLLAHPAGADTAVGEAGGFHLTLDGRLNAFVSHASGSGVPPMIPDYTGVDDEPNAANRIVSTRIRTGFLTSVVGLTATQTVGRTKLVGRVGLWLLAASSRAKNDLPPVDAREVYVRIEGPWGAFTAGRALSLFPRGAIRLDFDMGHGFGLGHPCATQIVIGGSCGHVGYGTTFPGFNAGMVYETPFLGPLQIAVGAYDPSIIPAGRYERTALPRFEGEATLRFGTYVTAFGHGFAQRLSRTVTDIEAGKQLDQDQLAHGAGGGVTLALGPVRLGGAAFAGKGLGMFLPIENNPIVIDEKGELRASSGGFLRAAVDLGDTRVSAGLGQSRMNKTPNDPGPVIEDESGVVMPGNPKLIRSQTGLSLGLYRRFGPVVVAAEYFRAEHVWHDYGEAVDKGIAIKRPRQSVDFVNLGLTMTF